MLGFKPAIRLFFLSLLLLGGSSALAWDYTVSVNGNAISVHFDGFKDDGGYCCAGAEVAGGSSSGTNCSSGPIPQTRTITCNRVGTHVLYVKAADATTRNLPGGPYETRTTTVTITTPPPVTCPAFYFFANTNRA